MNCGFRPTDITVTKTQYADPRYNYDVLSKLSDQEAEKLKKERDKYILLNIPFQFMHGERLRVTITEKGAFLSLDENNQPDR